jgi:predicted transcriptional regulator
MAMLQNSRLFTISLPEKVADQLLKMAAEEGRDPSDLLVEGFKRVLWDRVEKSLEAGAAEAQADRGDRYTEEDVERLVDEVRAEMAAEREARSKLTA